MEVARTLLASVLAAALVLLSPGSRAWAQAAEVATGADFGAAQTARVVSVPLASPSSLLGAPALAPAVSLSALSAPTAFAAAPAPAAASAVSALPLAATPSAAAAEPASAPATSALAAAPAVAVRAAPVSAPLAEASRALSTAHGFGARAGALDRLFTGARRALGLRDAPVSAVSGAAASAPALARSAPVAGSAPRAKVPAPRAAAAVPALSLAAAFGVAAMGVSVVQPLTGLAALMLSLVLHEIGHAKVAAALGDPTATRAGRASFNPLTWGRHVDPLMTIVLPLATFFMGGFIFGGAKPVPVEAAYFQRPVRDMALVALAGPAVNLALAGAGAFAYAAAASLGLGAAALGVLTTFVFVNALLAVFNLIPVRPLDGGHVLAAVLPRAVSARLDAAYARLGMFGLLPVLVLALLGGGLVMAAAAAVTHLLIGLSVAATGVQLAGAVMPAIAALGLAVGSLGGPPSAAAPAGPPSGTATLVVVFDPTRPAGIHKDLHLSALNARRPDYVQNYQRTYGALMADVAAQGVTADELASFNASPVASYRRINAATFALDAAKAEQFAAALRLQGHKVYSNERRRIIAPIVPVVPQDAAPSARAAVTMAENLKITHADAVQAIARARWGAPDMNPWSRALQAARGLLTGDRPVQPKIGVVDSGADTSHPLLKRVKQVQNFTSGPNADDIGHGSWVTSMVLNYAPWLSNLTHYKTFTDGGATLDDILKSLTAAANDGNLVISNSWGSDDGDPESPDSVLVKKLAQEGHIMVFAAGNAGPGANTIGSPAIVQFKDPTTGAIRVVAVAAADRGRKIASFSSVGPGSAKTAGKPGFAHRPDLASVGVNVEGAWPAALGDADRTDPAQGPLKAISGTSMSTPTVAGAIVLLAMLFGVVAIGPKLDAVVAAVMSTLDKTGLNDADHEGGGFIDVKAAYDSLVRQFGAPGVAPAHIAQFRRLSAAVYEQQASIDAFRRAIAAQPGPLRDDLLNNVEEMENASAPTRRALAALVAAHPNVAYEAAGPLGRVWLRLTGRGPKS